MFKILEEKIKFLQEMKKLMNLHEPVSIKNIKFGRRLGADIY